jgi:hypothetical protein
MASALDEAELVPVRARTATIIIESGRQNVSGDMRLPSAPNTRMGKQAATAKQGVATRTVLELPSPHAHLLYSTDRSSSSSGSSGSGGSGGTAQGQQAQEASCYPLSVQQQQQQQQQRQPQDLPPAVQAVKRAVPRSNDGLRISSTAGGDSRQITYQQQEVLQRQQATAAADALIAQQVETVVLDTWTVCVLVELLGSHLITPSCTPSALLPAAAVQLPETADLLGVPANCTSDVECSWQRGYVCTLCRASDVQHEEQLQQQQQQQQQRFVCSLDDASACKGPPTQYVPTDLMGACISYPQFLEVLLVLAVCQSRELLQPEPQQLATDLLDDDVQVWRHRLLLMLCSIYAAHHKAQGRKGWGKSYACYYINTTQPAHAHMVSACCMIRPSCCRSTYIQ